MFPRAGLFEKAGEEGRKKQIIVNNIKIYHICVGARHNETH
jgi:hypothetical protein